MPAGGARTLPRERNACARECLLTPLERGSRLSSATPSVLEVSGWPNAHNGQAKISGLKKVC